MGIDRSPANQRGFLIPLPFTDQDIWDAESTHTTAEKQAGPALPYGNEKLIINTSGAQTDELDLKTQNAGTPGKNRAGFIWKRAMDTNFYGDNSLNSINDYKLLKLQRSVAPTASYGPPSCCPLVNGDLLMAYSSTETGGNNGIMVKRMKADESTFSAGTLAFNSLDFLSTGTASYPAMVQLPDESVLLIHWINYTSAVSANLANLYVHRSTDNGVNWNLISEGALDEDISTSTYTLGKIFVEFYNGQLLLIGDVTKTGAANGDDLLQAASINEGVSWKTIEIGQTKEYFKPSLCVTKNGFFLSFITRTVLNQSRGACRILPNAFFPISDLVFEELTNYDVGEWDNAAKLFIEGEHITWVDDEDNIFAVFKNLSTQNNTYGGNGGLWMVISPNDGENWYRVGESPLYPTTDPTTNNISSYIFSQDDDNFYLRDLSACTAKGRSWIFSRYVTSAGTNDNSILYFSMRGYSSITLPGKTSNPTIYQEFGWNHTYLPFELPVSLSTWTETKAGAPTVEITTDGLKINTSTTTNQTYQYAFSPDLGSTDPGIVARFVVRSVSGGTTTANERAVIIYNSDAAHSYKVVFRFSPTQILMRDDLAGSSLATVTPSPSTIITDIGVEILVAMGNGKISAWFRSNDHIDAKGWNEIGVNLTISDGGAAAANYLSFGNMVAPTAGTVDSYFGEFCIAYPKSAGGKYFPNLADGFGTPGDLKGKLYPGYGSNTFVHNGLFLSTMDGPAFKGDEFAINPQSNYGIENIFHSQSPSPQNGWRSTAVTSGTVPSEFIPLQLDANNENIQFMSDVYGIHMEGINFEEFKIEGYNASTSSWVVIATINTGINVKSYRLGNRLRADSTGAAPYPYFFHNELEGWIADLGSVQRRIKTNSEGSWRGLSQPRPAIIQLMDTENTDPANPNTKLIPDKVSVVFNLNSDQYSAIGIRISTQNTITNDFRIGHLSIGPVHIIAPQYARGRSISFTANTQEFEQSDGIIRTRNRGIGKRSYRVAWSEPIDTSAFFPYDGSPDPDYWRLGTSAGSQAVASYGGAPYNFLGYIRHIKGTDRPVVYLPKIDYANSLAEEIRVMNRYNQHALCYMGNDVSIENVIGDEFLSDNKGEAFRISTISLTEVI
tara:strand:+ start:5543 stop:8908 length:3366 start_codon:yes stop_codon:yes gene_type:complete